MSGAANEDADKWTYGVRVIPDIINRARWRNTLTYRPFSRLTVGVEYNPLARDVRPLVNFLAVTETENRPAVMLGTSSDRIGTPEGQSYYVTVSKNLKSWTNLPVAPYAGVAYSSFEHRFLPIGGVNVSFSERWSSLVIFDGVKVSPTLSYSRGRHVFSFVLARGNRAGMSYSVSF